MAITLSNREMINTPCTKGRVYISSISWQLLKRREQCTDSECQHGLRSRGQHQDSIPMARFLEEPSNEHGLAFLRTESRTLLASRTVVAEHQEDHDFAYIGAHFDVDLGLEMNEDMVEEEEKAREDLFKRKE